MAKNFWHTKTLFIDSNWKYKWSYKNDFCINCKTCKFKHKWRWLCTSCFEKERKTKSNKRKFNLKKQNTKFYVKSRVLHYLNKKEDLRFRKRRSNFNEKEYKKKYYIDNLERLKLQSKTHRRLKKWLPCLKIIVNWKDKFLPFESLDKPSQYNNLNYSEEYDEWKEKIRQFDLLVNFWKKKT